MAVTSMNMDTLAVCGVGVVASEALLEAMISRSGGVEAIKAAVEASHYWPRFVELARAGGVDTSLLPAGALTSCLLAWAQQQR